MAKQTYTLTTEQQARRGDYIQLLETSRIARQKVEEFTNSCNHVIDPVIHDKMFNSEGAWCYICDSGFGWKCPESPDHVCHYFSSNDGTTVQLIDKSFHTLSEPSDVECETEDCCLFCGDPDERK